MGACNWASSVFCRREHETCRCRTCRRIRLWRWELRRSWRDRRGCDDFGRFAASNENPGQRARKHPRTSAPEQADESRRSHNFSLIQSRSAVSCEKSLRVRLTRRTGVARLSCRQFDVEPCGRADIDRHGTVRLTGALDHQFESYISVDPTQEISTSRIGNGRRARAPPESCAEICREPYALKRADTFCCAFKDRSPTALAGSPASMRARHLQRGLRRPRCTRP